MFILSSLSMLAQKYRKRRLRAWTSDHIASLPREIQKDIGWPGDYLNDDTSRRAVRK